MFCMSTYLKSLKKAAKNSRMSNEEFVRAVFDTLILSANIKNQHGDPLDLDKSRISKILSQKDDVPSAMKDALMDKGIEDTIRDSFKKFIKEYLNSELLSTVADEIMAQIDDDPNLTEETKGRLHQDLTQYDSFLLRAFFESVRINNIATAHDECFIWSKGSNSFRAIPGDLFKFAFGNRSKEKNIVVIPVNTSFDTHVSTAMENDPYPLVSESTIHGKWLNRMVHSGVPIQDLDNRISENLKRQNEMPSEHSLSETAKPDCYPIGTIAVVEEKNTIYYLLAVSHFDAENVAQSTPEEIKDALTKLLVFYDHRGQGYKMYLPLIGTGRSRSSLSNQQSADLIISTFLKNEKHIQGNIFLVILSEIYPTIHYQTKTEVLL